MAKDDAEKDDAIVDEDMVGDAVRYMAQFPHPIAVARKSMTDATNAYNKIYSAVYLEQEGTIKDRAAHTELDERVIKAKTAVTAAQFEIDQHKVRIESCSMIVEIWRSEGANKRASERFR